MSRLSPCVEWADYEDILDDCDTTNIHPDTLAAAFTFASDVLYNLTKRRWPGLCTDEFRPFCDCRCWLPSCGHDSSIYHSAVKLPAIDIRAITEVKVDGVIVPANEYVLRGRYLFARRQADGTLRAWPCWNDIHANDDAVDTFSIAYTHGADPPASMIRACALLAYEFAQAWTPECAASCRLPQRITTITRAGTTFAVLDPNLFEDGTGISDIDVLIKAVNRGESYQRPFVGRAGSSLNQVFR